MRGLLLRQQIGSTMKAMRKSGQRSAVGDQLQPVEVFILAGGLSARMGRDKARLRLRGRTLLAWVRAAARATGWPVRVIRRDLVPRCGPLGECGLRCVAAGRSGLYFSHATCRS